MAETRTGPCGCIVERQPCGLLRNLHRCASHVADVKARPTGEALYRDLGAIDARGIPGHARYIAELVDALADIAPPKVPMAEGGLRALEVGAGLGMYAPYLMDRGYAYEAIEPEPWGAEWIASTFRAPVFRGPVEEFVPLLPYGVIVAAHVIEHLSDASAALALLRSWLLPRGTLVMIVPNDEDLWNPEHVWFGDETAWRGVLSTAGFVNIRCATRRRIARERFLYFVAGRP